MKLKATKKEILSKSNKVLSVGHCELQSLLTYERPFAYSCGVYGWSCDYYNIDGVIISTGYSPIGYEVDYSIVKEYEDKANKLRASIRFHKNGKEKLGKLLKEFISKAV